MPFHFLLASLEKSLGKLLKILLHKHQLLLVAAALVTIGVPLFFASIALAKEQKTFKLLIMDSQAANPYEEARLSLLKALGSFGYVEGRNLKTVVKYSGNDIRAGERILNREIKNSYDVIYAGGTAATISARNVLHGKTQPVVFGSVTDPVGIGVIKDFTSKPGANFTGVCYPVPVKARLRFLKRLMPKAKTFGLIYADMPQSRSYNKWLGNLLKNDPEFKGISIIFRPVPLATGQDGARTMAANAKKYIHALDAKVDAYISANDQMGANRYFSQMVYKTSKKPLIGIEKDDVMGHWGAIAVIYPAGDSIGNQSARMIKRLFEGVKISEIMPEWPQQYGFAVDLRKARRFGVDIPVEVLQMAGENIVH